MSSPLIPSSIFFISSIVVFISKNFRGSFSYHLCLYWKLNMWLCLLILSFLSVLCWFQLIEFYSSLWQVFSPCGFCLSDSRFDWSLDIVDFSLLNAGYFCISINIIEFCSWTHCYYKTVWSSIVFLLKFIRQG